MADQIEGVDFKDDGRITLSVAGKQVTLRRPTFGEWKELAEQHDVITQDLADDQLDLELTLADMGDGESDLAVAMSRMADAVRTITTHLTEDDRPRLQEFVDSLADLTETPAVSDPEERKTRRKTERERRVLVGELKANGLERRIGWTATVLETLGKPTIKADDLEPEPWMGTFNFCQSVVNHWERLPKVAGKN